MGEPFTSLGKMLNLIRGTQGAPATASLDRRRYPVGEKVSAEQMRDLNLTRARVCPNWNYTLSPRRDAHNLDSGP